MLCHITGLFCFACTLSAFVPLYHGMLCFYNIQFNVIKLSPFSYATIVHAGNIIGFIRNQMSED